MCYKIMSDIYVISCKGFEDFNEKSNDLMRYLKENYKYLELTLDETKHFLRNNNNENITVIFHSHTEYNFKFYVLRFINLNNFKSNIIFTTFDFWHFDASPAKKKYYLRESFICNKHKIITFADVKQLEYFRKINCNNTKKNIFTLNLWSVYDKAKCEFNKNPINKILLTGRINKHYPERYYLRIYKHIQVYGYNDNDIKKNTNNFNLELNKYLCCFTSSVHFRSQTSKKSENTHILLLKVFEILGSGSLLLYPKKEEQYIKKFGLFHKDNCWLLDFNGDIQKQLNYIVDEKNRKEIDEIRYRGWRHGIEKLNSYNKFLEFDNIVRNINRKYKLFNLNMINTLNKPGSLANIDIKKISQELKIDFIATKSFYINNLDSEKSRGNHSNSNINELLICLSGEFEIKLFDGKKEEKYVIKENSGIYVPKNIWIEFYNFKKCVLLVYTDLKDDEIKHSIYSKEEFIKKI